MLCVGRTRRFSEKDFPEYKCENTCILYSVHIYIFFSFHSSRVECKKGKIKFCFTSLDWNNLIVIFITCALNSMTNKIVCHFCVPKLIKKRKQVDHRVYKFCMLGLTWSISVKSFCLRQTKSFDLSWLNKDLVVQVSIHPDLYN